MQGRGARDRVSGNWSMSGEKRGAIREEEGGSKRSECLGYEDKAGRANRRNWQTRREKGL